MVYYIVILSICILCWNVLRKLVFRMYMSMAFLMELILQMAGMKAFLSLYIRGLELVRDLEDWMEEQQFGKIASIAGQNDILDVKEDLTRLEAYYKVLTQADNVNPFSAGEYIQLRYDQLEEDSTITPATLEGGNCILEGDVMIEHSCY